MRARRSRSSPSARSITIAPITVDRPSFSCTSNFLHYSEPA
jgi:hypothetical protein